MNDLACKIFILRKYRRIFINWETTWDSGMLSVREIYLIIQESKYYGCDITLPLVYPFFFSLSLGDLMSLVAGLKLVLFFSSRSLGRTQPPSFSYPSHSSWETWPPHSVHYYVPLPSLTHSLLVFPWRFVSTRPSFDVNHYNCPCSRSSVVFCPTLPTVSHSLPFLPVSFHCRFRLFAFLYLPLTF